MRISPLLLQEITHRLVDEFQPEEIILFGSYAWGKPDEDSDLDLLVIVSHSNLSPARRAMRAHRRLQGLNVPKDILVRTRAEVERFRNVQASLERQIFEKGTVLYERQAGTRAELTLSSLCCLPWCVHSIQIIGRLRHPLVAEPPYLLRFVGISARWRILRYWT